MGRGVYRVLVGKTEGKSPLGRRGRRWEDGPSGSGMWGYGMDCSGSGFRQMADSCESGNEPSGSIKCGEFLD